ncbi:3-oxoacyl-ACP reductase FabG [Sporomusa sp.]|uniref:3-oxoacyl-ACP reductase FabG n=1 Tax=Sporomusa sp. TaxID=2078658 RepID=UPI002CB4FB96|nr:3-oxoacyl-ACP reductase FabG [Sporomusa sp.]HWR06971.1 3-oxoacyl-ACP reductase FabG [Sporomusa sp.]
MLEGKKALITGCKRGIGKGIAITLAKYGADVVLNDIEISEEDEVAVEVQKLGRKALCVSADITSQDSVAEMFAKIKQTFGGLDILVNNAGITADAMSYKMSVEQWNRVLAVNLTGTFLCCQAAAKLMMEQQSGKIINTSSIAGFIGNIGQANYSATKGGVAAMTKTLAKELAKKGIYVNAVSPGFINTPMTDKIPDEVKQQMISRIPVGRIGEPEDIANVVLFLASPLSDYVTGQTIQVNGGTFM